MHEVVVGIDFGATGIGFAYSFNNKDDIIIGKFLAHWIDAKIPTQIILDSNNGTLAFGAECKKYIDDNGLNNNGLYFKKIKMNLYENKEYIIPENS